MKQSKSRFELGETVLFYNSLSNRHEEKKITGIHNNSKGLFDGFDYELEGVDFRVSDKYLTPCIDFWKRNYPKDEKSNKFIEKYIDAFNSERDAIELYIHLLDYTSKYNSDKCVDKKMPETVHTGSILFSLRRIIYGMINEISILKEENLKNFGHEQLISLLEAIVSSTEELNLTSEEICGVIRSLTFNLKYEKESANSKIRNFKSRDIINEKLSKIKSENPVNFIANKNPKSFFKRIFNL